MDNSNRQMNRHTDYLGVSKIEKNMKSPIHQPNFTNTARPQPLRIKASKNIFRAIVQELTGSHDAGPKRPESPISAYMRPFQNSIIDSGPRAIQSEPYPHSLPQDSEFGTWPNIAESPISAYMRYLQNSILDSGPRAIQSEPYPHSLPQDSEFGAWPNIAESPISAYMRYLQNSILDSGPRAIQSEPYPHSLPQVSEFDLLDRVRPPLKSRNNICIQEIGTDSPGSSSIPPPIQPGYESESSVGNRPMFQQGDSSSQRDEKSQSNSDSSSDSRYLEVFTQILRRQR